MIAKNNEFTVEDLGSSQLMQRDKNNQLIGENNELRRQIEVLTATIAKLQPDAIELQRLRQHAEDVVEWVVEDATDKHGRLIKHTVDAALGGEDWVPGWVVKNGKRISLLSTIYEVSEV
jgi:hypothetical protein